MKGQQDKLSFKSVAKFQQFVGLKGKKDITPLEGARTKLMAKTRAELKMKETDLFE